MRRSGSLILLSALILTGLIRCGTNTDRPVYSIFSLLSVAAPAIVDVAPVDISEGLFGTPGYRLRYGFDVKYYVTNQEPEFVGYNLYITTTSLSTEAILTGIGTDPYLPLGYEPTFYHSPSEANTSSSSLITKRVTALKAPPGEIPFQICEKYFFRLQAVLLTGVESAPGPQISSCAFYDSTLCPSDSSCN
ncbi:MAG: hypothetical protein CMN76_15980 [Spirochaetaceae bacterium]|nr:hypothetical protein [Spirochaetaceae bacterium]|tara:strand:- start:41680 stop:42252 length:573 start_codon:yes stop_codon:yes gene_type:complete